MTKIKTQKGFTLVELAIVMTIIGLLIGGILKGQELMENARVTATISQVRSYEAATTTFRDTFSAIPGDMANAATRIPNCTVACTAQDDGAQAAGNQTAGNSVVGFTGGIAIEQADTGNAVNTSDEAVLYWTHLLLADLISGVSDAGITAGAAAAGETHPVAKLGGVFRVGHGDGGAVAAMGGVDLPNGLTLAITPGPTGALSNTSGIQAISPLRAGQIDRKMDDGKPTTGYVRAYGEVDNTAGASACIDLVTAAAVYLEATSEKDCGLLFRIQG